MAKALEYYVIRPIFTRIPDNPLHMLNYIDHIQIIYLLGILKNICLLPNNLHALSLLQNKQH
jgi:hypothetical protein